MNSAGHIWSRAGAVSQVHCRGAQGGRRGESGLFAWLSAGLYETEGRYAEALQLSRAALDLAQKNSLPDAVYQWQWLVGRLHNLLGDRDRAIDSYQTAISNLQTIRNDLAIVYGNVNSPTTFRDSVGPIYYELADLILKKPMIRRMPQHALSCCLRLAKRSRR